MNKQKMMCLFTLLTTCATITACGAKAEETVGVFQIASTTGR